MATVFKEAKGGEQGQGSSSKDDDMEFEQQTQL